MPATSSSPSVLRRAATTAEVPTRRLSTVESSTLLEALEAVPDPRQRRGRRHRLQSVLYLALGAVLAGADSWAAIADWAAVTNHDVAAGRPPHPSTFRRLLSRVDVTALEAALTGWVLSRRDAATSPLAEQRIVVAADGKTLRGAHQPDGSQTKLFCLYDHAHSLVLTQTPVIDGDEITAFTTALSALPDLHEVVVTADALHCQRAHASWLHVRGGHYLFTVKANQPTLRRAVATLPWGQLTGSRHQQVGHGRTGPARSRWGCHCGRLGVVLFCGGCGNRRPGMMVGCWEPGRAGRAAGCSGTAGRWPAGGWGCAAGWPALGCGPGRQPTLPGREVGMATLTVWRFPDTDGAEQALSTLQDLQKQELIKVHDGAVVTWPAGAKKPKTRQLHSMAGVGALGGSFWGLLFGLLFFVPLLGMAAGAALGAAAGSMRDVGIDDDFIGQVREKVTPGTSALFVLTSEAVIDKVHEAFAGQRMELVNTNLSQEQEARLRDVFAE